MLRHIWLSPNEWLLLHQVNRITQTSGSFFVITNLIRIAMMQRTTVSQTDDRFAIVSGKKSQLITFEFYITTLF